MFLLTIGVFIHMYVFALFDHSEDVSLDKISKLGSERQWIYSYPPYPNDVSKVLYCLQSCYVAICRLVVRVRRG